MSESSSESVKGPSTEQQSPEETPSGAPRLPLGAEQQSAMRTLAGFAALTIFLTVAYSIRTAPTAGTLLSAAVTAAALALVRNGLTPATSFQAIATIAWLYWGLSFLSNLIEAVAFHVLPLQTAARSIGVQLALAILAACLLECFMPPPQPGRPAQTIVATGLFWRLPLLALAFLAVYLAAGIAIQPWIMSFYAGRPLPSLVTLSILAPCRGLLDLACMYPWFHAWALSRRRAACAAAYVFPALCGWGPLLLPNQYLPPAIRLAHAAEMGGSGILFGALAALVLRRSRPLPNLPRVPRSATCAALWRSGPSEPSSSCAACNPSAGTRRACPAS